MKERVWMILFVLVLGSFLTAALLAVTNYTDPIIEKNNELMVKKSILLALGIPYSEETVESVFSMNIDKVPKGVATFYFSKSGEVAFEVSGSGLWGPVDGVIALMPDHRSIKGLTIIRQEETPGLGGRIAEDEFLNRFKNKVVVPKLEIVAEGKATKENQVDGITGATMSGKALESLLNSEMGKYLPLLSQ